MTYLSQDNTIRLLSIDDLGRAVYIQSKAFQNDPLWKYLIPDSEKRAKLLPKFNNVFLEIGIKSYQTYSVSNPIEGVAVWSAPNQKEIASSGSAAIGFSRLFLSSLLIPFLKALRIFRRFETMQKKYAPEPHYYLEKPFFTLLYLAQRIKCKGFVKMGGFLSFSVVAKIFRATRRLDRLLCEVESTRA